MSGDLKALHERLCGTCILKAAMHQHENSNLDYGRAQGVELAAEELGITLGDPVSDRLTRWKENNACRAAR